MRKMIFHMRFLLGVGVVALSVFIVNYHFPFSGMKETLYDFRVPEGTISHVYPVARVRDMAFANGHSYRPMIEDPVYVDIKTSIPYQRARITVFYQNTTGIPLQIGLKQTASTAAFELKSFENEAREGEWQRGEATFDLSAASYYNKKYTIAFSVPGLRTEGTRQGEVRLSQMRLTLQRPPLSWKDITTLWRKE